MSRATTVIRYPGPYVAEVISLDGVPRIRVLTAGDRKLVGYFADVASIPVDLAEIEIKEAAA